MWNRTLAALLGGLLIAVSWVLSLNLLLAVLTTAAADTRLLTGLLLSFVVWAGAMTWIYAAQGFRSWKRAAVLLTPSLLLNIALMAGT